MIVTVFVCLDHINQQSCQIVGISRRTDLIGNNGQFVVRFCHIQHGFDKVLSVFTEYPCDTNDKIFIQSGRYGKFSVQFGLAVYI